MGSIRNKNMLLWSAVWALLVSSGATLDWYDEPGRSLNEDIYQNYNVEGGPRALGSAEDGKDVVDDMGRAMLLYKIMQSLKLSKGIAGQYYRPNPDSVDYVDQPPMNMDIKVVKRVTKAAQPEDAKKTNAQAQTQSKPTKVKATRAPVLCYFKLCSYRVSF